MEVFCLFKKKKRFHLYNLIVSINHNLRNEGWAEWIWTCNHLFVYHMNAAPAPGRLAYFFTLHFERLDTYTGSMSSTFYILPYERLHTYTDSTSSIFCLCSKAIEFSPFWHLSHSIFPYLQKWVKNVPKIQTIPQQVIWNLVFLLAPLPLYPPIHSLLCTCVCVCVCVCVCAWVHACAGMMCEEYNDYKN